MSQDLIGRLSAVRERADAAAREAGRDPGEVRIMLATKTQSAATILPALQAGWTLIGENRVQELVEKAPELAAVEHEAHMIGPLQSNKINKVLDHASCLQSLDSLSLAEKLQRRLEDREASLDVFLQVNTSREDSKSGIAPAEAAELARQVGVLDRLRVRGLMTIGLPGSEPEEIRPSYRELREIRDRLLQDGDLPAEATELSMGMSADYELAIAEGATLVRIGSSVFGARPPAS